MKNFILTILIVGMFEASSITCQASENCNTEAYKVKQSSTDSERIISELPPLYKAYVNAFNVCHENYSKARRLEKAGLPIDASFKQLALEDNVIAQRKLTEFTQQVELFQNSSDALVCEISKTFLKLSVLANKNLEKMYAYIANPEAVFTSPDVFIEMINETVLINEESEHINNLYDLLMKQQVYRALKTK